MKHRPPQRVANRWSSFDHAHALALDLAVDFGRACVPVPVLVVVPLLLTAVLLPRLVLISMSTSLRASMEVENPPTPRRWLASRLPAHYAVKYLCSECPLTSGDADYTD